MKLKFLAFIAASLTTSINAAVTYDSDGIGFVGKGDIQTVFDWNNSQLQENAAKLHFRFISAGTASWVCEWWTGPENNRKYHAVEASVSTSVDAQAAIDPRKNSKGMITGFSLNGLIPGADTSNEIGYCGGQGAGKTLVEDSINYQGSEDPLLQVKFGADGDWFDLPITF